MCWESKGNEQRVSFRNEARLPRRLNHENNLQAEHVKTQSAIYGLNSFLCYLASALQ